MINRCAGAVLSLSLLCGCGAMNDLKNQSEDLKRMTQHLSKRTEDVERELVNKDSTTVMLENLGRLFGGGSADDSEPTLMVYAGYAVEAMRFQFWKGDYSEDLAVLDNFMEQPLEILFAHATAHIPRDFDLNMMVPDRDFKAVGSIASKLERMRDEYEQTLRAKGLPPMSAYNVIMEALRNRGSNGRRELLPKSAAMVLQWKDEAIYMMQLRHNYLPLTVLGRMTKFQDHGNLDRLMDLLFGMDAIISNADPEQLKLWTLWLNEALETRQALADMCIPPEYNNSIFTILRKVDIRADRPSVLQRGLIDAFKQVASRQVKPNLSCER